MTTMHPERCDSCGAQAYYAATKDEQQLHFCGNHTRSNAKRLLGAGFTINPDTYTTYGAETLASEEATYRQREIEEAAETRARHEETRNKIKHFFRHHPAEALEKIIIPTARKSASYTRDIHLELRFEENGNFALNMVPAEKPETQREMEEFMEFSATLNSVMDSLLA